LEGYEFKIDGNALRKGVPIPLAISALDSFQSILDKTYLVGIDKKKITARERERFFLRATEFKHGSLLTHFDIVMQGVQLGLPIDIISILHILDRDFFPRAESQSQVVQSTGNSHNQIRKTFEPVSAFVFNNSVPFDAAYNMLYSDSYS